jgi:hypothetical protein
MYNCSLKKASSVNLQNSSKLAAYLGFVVVPIVDLNGITSQAPMLPQRELAR